MSLARSLLVILSGLFWSCHAQGSTGGTPSTTNTTNFTNCDITSEPYLSLNSVMNLSISYNNNSTLACFGSNSSARTGTCCDFEETRKAIQKITQTTIQQWQTYLDAVNIYFEKAVPILQVFFNNYDTMVQTFNRAPYDVYKYLQIVLANRKHYTTLRDFLKESGTKKILKNNATACYSSLATIRANLLCDLCKNSSYAWVNKSEGNLYTRDYKIFDGTCSSMMNACFDYFRANYYITASISLYLVFSNLRYGTTLPTLDPNTIFNTEKITAIMNVFLNCEKTTNDGCKSADMLQACTTWLSVFGVNPFVEGSASTINQMLQNLNVSTPLKLPTLSDSIFLKYNVNFTSSSSNASNPADSAYVRIVTNVSDPLFKDLVLNTTDITLPTATTTSAQVLTFLYAGLIAALACYLL